MTFKEFKNQVRTLVQEDIVDGKIVVAKNLNDYLGSFFEGTEKLLVKSENDKIEYYVDGFDTTTNAADYNELTENFSCVEGMSEEFFENNYLYIFYVDCVRDGAA